MNQTSLFGRLRWMLGAGIVVRVLSAATTIALMGLLTPEIYGRYTYAMSVGLTVMMIVSAGLPDYIVSRAKQEKKSLPYVLRCSWRLQLILGLAALGGVTLFLFAQPLTITERITTLAMTGAAILASMTQTAQAALRAIHRVITQAKLIAANGFVLASALLTAGYFYPHLLALGGAHLLVFVVLFALHHHTLGRHEFAYSDHATNITQNDLLPIAQRTLPFALIPFLEYALPLSASSIVLRSFDPQTLGSFNIAIALYLSTLMIVTLLDQVFYPVLVTIPTERQPSAHQSYFLCSLVLAFPACILFFTFAELLANLSLFHKYAQLPNMFRVLAGLIPLCFLVRFQSVSFRIQDRQGRAIFGLGGAMLWLIVIVPWLVKPDSIIAVGQAFLISLTIPLVICSHWLPWRAIFCSPAMARFTLLAGVLTGAATLCNQSFGAMILLLAAYGTGLVLLRIPQSISAMLPLDTAPAAPQPTDLT